jgi:hypothetical protein
LQKGPLYFHLPTCITIVPNRWTLMTFLVLGMCIKICHENPNLIKIREKYQELYMNMYTVYTFYCCWRHLITIRALSLSEDGIRQLPSVSVHRYQHGSHWMDVCEIWCWGLLWKSVGKFKIWLKSGRNIGHFTWSHKYILLMATDSFCKITLFHRSDILLG